MKRKIRTPYFEIGTKNYIYGDKVLEYAKAADAAAEKLVKLGYTNIVEFGGILDWKGETVSGK